ncbi:hypothetical protein WJX73_000816 [Symbiochloris irregularis]|uniref:Uncharacterized protein n=1 Tax=Symbiochloris irregularis TaxID=706552 RepID=A0AAW1PWQ6_9CHLO
MLEAALREARSGGTGTQNAPRGGVAGSHSDNLLQNVGHIKRGNSMRATICKSLAVTLGILAAAVIVSLLTASYQPWPPQVPASLPWAKAQPSPVVSQQHKADIPSAPPPAAGSHLFPSRPAEAAKSWADQLRTLDGAQLRTALKGFISATAGQDPTLARDLGLGLLGNLTASDMVHQAATTPELARDVAQGLLSRLPTRDLLRQTLAGGPAAVCHPSMAQAGLATAVALSGLWFILQAVTQHRRSTVLVLQHPHSRPTALDASNELRVLPSSEAPDGHAEAADRWAALYRDYTNASLESDPQVVMEGQEEVAARFHTYAEHFPLHRQQMEGHALDPLLAMMQNTGNNSAARQAALAIGFLAKEDAVCDF